MKFAIQHRYASPLDWRAETARAEHLTAEETRWADELDLVRWSERQATRARDARDPLKALVLARQAPAWAIRERRAWSFLECKRVGRTLHVQYLLRL